jgi:16S rRNA processing protein RimM
MKPEMHTSSPGRLIALGEIVGTHGVRGLLRFHPYDRASSPPPTGEPVYLTTRASEGADTARAAATTVILDDARPHGTVLLLRVRGISDIDAATPLVGKTLAVEEDVLPAPAPGEFYVYQLAGLDVVTGAGERIGTVERSFSTGANEVLVVQDGTREILIPMIADVVRAIDLPGHRLVIDPIPGLLDA